ncbi:hypothetical protein [Cellulomonas chengniuliangii]|uniref:Lipoprotein n=1 Tax=Cellulomonas chengniuliangii TaxID=2968084 RepID=A0ABY5L2Z9_9CELL|nr:hypothetical protein [Cellulomonas chengniuliangii]MCC2307384.1 hypothetical protein [Cellulomonas chengniuliangii]MCC2317993.1 hypothetical protein [Cellulomonas chengniuliangii]UUI75835.1 hypothetical protein NP064_02655 [Cellulomonas chengniuliangii]
MRQQALATLVCLASTTALSACINYDAARPAMSLTNNSDEAVTVRIEGATPSREQDVGPREALLYELDACAGTAIVVETQDGDSVGRVQQKACPSWTLTIEEDGTLDYAEWD